MGGQRLPRWLRWAFGRPRIVHAVLWSILGAASIVLGASYTQNNVRNSWAMFALAAWALVVAGIYLVIALRDRRRGTGAYGRHDSL